MLQQMLPVCMLKTIIVRVVQYARVFTVWASMYSMGEYVKWLSKKYRQTLAVICGARPQNIPSGIPSLTKKRPYRCCTEGLMPFLVLRYKGAIRISLRGL